MAGETYVDLSYRGLELGRRHRLCEVGPTTAYLEHPTPMPVGTRLELRADGGIGFTVEVTRVHEQVAGVARSPGMRARAIELDDRAAALWRSLVSVDDPPPPVFPVETAPAAVPEAIDDAPATEDARPTVDMAAVLPPPDDDEAKKTEQMAAVDIEAIMSGDSGPAGDSIAPPVAEDTASGKRRPRGGKRRKR